MVVLAVASLVQSLGHNRSLVPLLGDSGKLECILPRSLLGGLLDLLSNELLSSFAWKGGGREGRGREGGKREGGGRERGGKEGGGRGGRREGGERKGGGREEVVSMETVHTTTQCRYM